MNHLPKILALLVALSLFQFTSAEPLFSESESASSGPDESQSALCETEGSEGSNCDESQSAPLPWQEYDAPNIFEAHEYFDGKIRDYVGVENYEAWVQAHLNTPGGADVYLFFEDFDITPELLKGMLTDYVYERYMKYWPADTGR